MANTQLALVYSTTLPVVIGFAAFALYLSYKEKIKKQQSKSLISAENQQAQQVEYFLTAKNQSPFWIITYSLSSAALGAWVIFSVPSYAIYAGALGLFSYTFGSSITLLIPAYIGPIIQKKTNNSVLSLSDYVDKRFGRIAQIAITLICLYNMGVGLVSEYTAIGDLFEKVVKGSRVLIVVLLGLLTSVYSALGGLSVSVKTDQVQGYTVWLAFFFTIIFIACYFKMDWTSHLPENLRANETGYNSLFAMPVSLGAAVICSESFWQKAWTASSEKTLKQASWMAALFVFIIIGTFGFIGYMACWSGYRAEDENLAFFAIFNDETPLVFLIVITMFATIMSESAIDSYQLGIVSSISTCIFKKSPIIVIQSLVFLLNIPFIIISLKNYGIINLFLSANMLATATALPLIIGLFKKVQKYYNYIGLLSGILTGLICVSIYGISQMNSFKEGLHYVFYEEYLAASFAIAFFTAGAGSLIVAGIYYLLDKFNLYQINTQPNCLSEVEIIDEIQCNY